jgi:hypothetical protein
LRELPMRAVTLHPSRTRLIVVLSVVAVEVGWLTLLAYAGLRLLG